MLPLQLVLALSSVLPLWSCFRFATAASHLFRWITPRRARQARENISAALQIPAGDPRLESIVRASYRHFCLVTMELFVLPRLLKRSAPEELLRFHGREHVDAALAAGRGAVVATAHIGNWEVSGALGPLLGIPMVSIGKRLENPLVDGVLGTLRCRYGQRMVDKDGAFLTVARETRRGAFAGILLDVHAGRRGSRVEFFGRPASTFLHAARMARRFKVPFLPCFTARVEEPMRLEAEVGPPIEPDLSLDEEEDVYRMTLEFHRLLEAAIRRHPEQWQWFHRRWKKGGQDPPREWARRVARKKNRQQTAE